MRTLLSEESIVELNARFERAHPKEILRWALRESGIERVAIASAFQAEGTAVMHMTAGIRPGVPVLFLETGFHFDETIAFVDQLSRRLGLDVRPLRGEHTPETQEERFGPRLYERDPAACCEINKVRPMIAALRELDAWITAFRRDSSPTRSGASILDSYELEPGKRMLKINPVATWTRREVRHYLEEHDLPHNPLYDLGYSSIGCAPCTRMRLAGEPERAGRWAGLSKWECGIHERETAQQQPPAAGPA